MRQSSPQLHMQTQVKPLCVDLDGTLCYSDSLWECVAAALRKNPLVLFSLPFLLLSGRHRLKQQMAIYSHPESHRFPYNEEVLRYIKSERATGRPIILVTGAARPIAQAIADHVGVFDEVLSTDNNINLTGKNKLKVLIERFGEPGFDYIGNSFADLPIWRYSGNAIVVGRSFLLRRVLHAHNIVVKDSFELPTPGLRTIASHLRIHQWAKNLLVFLPLLLAHHWRNTHDWLVAGVAFLTFGFVASSVYTFNDLVDLEFDRHHPRKKHRAVACGLISIPQAFVLMIAMLLAGFVAAYVASHQLVSILIAYVVITVWYSLQSKRWLLVDVLTLAALYSIRVVAGGMVTGISISSWTLGYTGFLFLTLALMKRYSELLLVVNDESTSVRGRAYQTRDMPIVLALGIGSALVAALVLALYLRSPEVLILYRRPEWLLPLCVLHVYWTCRAWIIANRGAMHDDPVMFALKDKVSYIVAGCALASVYLAT